MDTVLNKISEIESSATSIMDQANIRKKEYTKEMEERTTTFDAQLEKDTNQKLEDLRNRMEIEMKTQLEQQRADAEATLKLMERNYKQNHEDYAATLFQQMIEE